MPRLTAFVGEGEIIPRGYGVVRQCWDRLGYVAAPVPLHWVIRYGELAWRWIISAGFRGPTVYRMIRRAYATGRANVHERWTDGHDVGYKAGLAQSELNSQLAYRDGWNACVDKMLADHRAFVESNKAREAERDKEATGDA